MLQTVCVCVPGGYQKGFPLSINQHHKFELSNHTNVQKSVE